MKTPLAMLCTQEQAKEITELCKKHGIEINYPFYKSGRFIVNDFDRAYGRAGFTYITSGRTLIPYNPSLFLYSLGVFPEKWAVIIENDEKRFAEFLKTGKYSFDKLGCYGTPESKRVYLLRDNKLHCEYSIPTDYTEVTLEDLIAHYKPKVGSVETKASVKYSIQPTLKLTITRTELLEIHKVACDTWQKKIAEYGKRLDLVSDTITFTESEVQEMFNASNSTQKEVLERIFGNPRKSELLAEKAELQKRIDEIDKQLTTK